MAALVKVLVLTNSLLEGWYTTPAILVFLETPSEPHEKLPVSSLKALNFWLPPLVLTEWILLAPILVLAGCLPNSNFLFFLNWALLAPVAERL